MRNEFYDLQDLQKLGLKMFGSCIYADVKIGEKYLQPEVINMWDWKDYGQFYTYFDGEGRKFVVRVCTRTDAKTTRCENLKKDLSNLKEEKE